MRTFTLTAAVAALVVPTVASAPADAQTRHHYVSHHRNVHHYRHRCFRGHGTTGLLVGGGAGALIGSAVTHGAAGPIVGAAGGALLGRHIQRHARCS